MSPLASRTASRNKVGATRSAFEPQTRPAPRQLLNKQCLPKSYRWKRDGDRKLMKQSPWPVVFSCAWQMTPDKRSSLQRAVK